MTSSPLLVFGLLIGVLPPGIAASLTSSGETTLAQLKGQKRVVLVFAPSADDPQLREQVRMWREHAAEARERDLVQIALPSGSRAEGNVRLTDANARSARERLLVAEQDFAVILIGKDGGEKLRARKPIPFQELKETIDAMPMRQDEMKRSR